MRKIYILYHFLHPDDVVSSVHFNELSVGLVKKGWDVMAFPCNRGRHDSSGAYPLEDVFQGVRIERIWRPPLRQSSNIGRILNALWMISRWSLLAIGRGRRPDVVIIGTDPILSVLVAFAWRLFRRDTIIVHWCFDLYPEAAYADGSLSSTGSLARGMHKILNAAYGACDLVVDIGSCMRRLLSRYDAVRKFATIVPWALEEPGHILSIPAAERSQLFGDAPLGLLYSGNLGRAHCYEPVLKLLRLLRDDGVHLTFSVRGSREEELRAALLPEDTNISVVPLAAAENLATRLASADIQVVTLREEWTGTVVPSKFFGALAIGRPVLFAGDRKSSIAQWIEQHDLGWVLTPDNTPDVAMALRELLHDPSAIQKKSRLCHEVYQAHFSREIAVSAWHRQLENLQPHWRKRGGKTSRL